MKRVPLIGMMVVFVMLCVLGKVCIGRLRPVAASQDELIYTNAISLIEENKSDEAIGRLEELVENFPDSEYVDEALIKMGDLYLKEARLPQAKACYEKVVYDLPFSNSIRSAQQKLWDVKLDILFSPLATPDSLIYTVAPGDTLAAVARKFEATIDLIKRSNRLSSDLIRPGMRLKVPSAKYSLVVDKSRNTLTLKSNEEILKVYQVSTGDLENPTPSGNFTIETKLVDPTWRGIPPGDPRNILGSRWLGFAEPSREYGIHGTTNPETIGKPITRGCIRMRDDDVKEIFTIVPIGTEVFIVD